MQKPTQTQEEKIRRENSDDVTLSKTIPSEEISQSPGDAILARQLKQGKTVEDLMKSYRREVQGKAQGKGENEAFRVLSDLLLQQLEQDSSINKDELIESYFTSLYKKYQQLLEERKSSQKSGDNPSVISEQKQTDNKKRHGSGNKYLDSKKRKSLKQKQNDDKKKRDFSVDMPSE